MRYDKKASGGSVRKVKILLTYYFFHIIIISTSRHLGTNILFRKFRQLVKNLISSKLISRIMKNVSFSYNNIRRFTGNFFIHLSKKICILKCLGILLQLLLRFSKNFIRNCPGCNRRVNPYIVVRMSYSILFLCPCQIITDKKKRRNC